MSRYRSNRKSNMSEAGFYAVALAIVIVIAILLSYVSSLIPGEARARTAAENLGLTNVHVMDRSPAWGQLGGCHDTDAAKFTVVGTDARGKVRTIEVCAPAFFGGYTVRS